MANEILLFCGTDTGTNLLTNLEYAADGDRTSGNKPGVASSRLNNKAIRQSSLIASQFAQALTNLNGTDVLDNGTTALVLQQILAGIMRIPPTITSRKTAGSGTHNLTYYFFCASGSATSGATYTHNATTYTVVSTVAAGTLFKLTGPAAPLASGTLTKSAGTGDTTLTFYAVRAPIALQVQAAGGGGGSSGSGTGSSNGTAGSNTTFGSDITAPGGGGGTMGGNAGGAAPTVNIGTGTWAPGGAGVQSGDAYSTGGGNQFVPANVSVTTPRAGVLGQGGSTGAPPLAGASVQATGGGGGSSVDTEIAAPLSGFAYTIGAGGAAGAAGGGSGAQSGAPGGPGFILTVEKYQ